MKFEDIKQYYRCGNYHVTVDLAYFLRHINHYLGYGLDMDPDFQRGHVWSERDQEKYIEHVLRGGPSGRSLYFNCPRWSMGERDNFVLVDGKQRIMAVTKFLNGELRVFGHTIEEFEGWMGFSGYHFDIYVNELPTKRDVLLWYLEMNSGGIVHTEEELDRVRGLLAKEMDQ